MPVDPNAGISYPGIKFCTVEQCRDISTIHPAFSGFNNRIEAYLRTATTQIIESCNREFVAKKNFAEYHGTPERRWRDLAFPIFEPYNIYLKEPNVNINTIQVYLSYRYVFTSDTILSKGDNTSVGDIETAPVFDIGTEVFGTGQDYYMEPVPNNTALWKVVITRELQYHPRSIKIIYDSGYNYDPDDNSLLIVPVQLVQATAIQACFLMSRAGNEDIGTGDLSRRATRRDPRSTPSGVTSETGWLLRSWRRSLTGGI